MKSTKEQVSLAINGDKNALEQLIVSVQDMIYNLALRMLWHPEDAKDATQEILIKIITNLSSFKFESEFKTWVYRLSKNNLINYKNSRQRKKQSFEEFGTQLKQGLAEGISFSQNEAEQKLLVVEAKIGCSNAMLQCLSPEDRMIYIVGEILDFNSNEAALVFEITAVNFRKKLSRIRQKLHAFLGGHCGIVNPENKCRCSKKVDSAIDKKIINPNHLLFTKGEPVEELIESIEKIQQEVDLFRSNPSYNTPAHLLQGIKELISTK